MHDRETVIGFTNARAEMSMPEAYNVCRAEHALPELPTVVP